MPKDNSLSLMPHRSEFVSQDLLIEPHYMVDMQGLQQNGNVLMFRTKHGAVGYTIHNGAATI
jgi:hypothetical protein